MMNGILRKTQWLIIGILYGLLIGCHTIHSTRPTSIQQTETVMDQSIRDNQAYLSDNNRKLPANINAALLPPLSHYVNPAKEEPVRFDVAANKVPAKEFYMGLVAGTNINMVVHPDITGTITLNLKNVTIRQTMDAVRDVYGYYYNKTSYGYEVMPAELQTQIFHINYLDVERNGKSFTQLTTGEVTSVGTISVGGSSSTTGMPNQPPGQLGGGPQGTANISSIETKSQMQFWKNIEKSIVGMLGTETGHSVTVNAQAGVIAVRAFPGELHNVARFINSLQSSLNRQVILEAKILEVELNDTFQAGIDWAVLSNPAAIDPNTGFPNTQGGIGQAADKIFSDTDLQALDGGIFAIRSNGNFKLLIQLLQSQGNVQVLSSPHISTVNNQKAVIKVGKDEFFVTGVSTTNTIVGNNTLPSQDVSLTPFFSGITLDVTPEISSDGEVTLQIHPSISVVTQQTKVIGLGSTGSAPNNLTLPLARSTIRESDNVVRARNGQVVVIGGLMQNNMAETIAETPFLGKIPFIGSVFRRTQQVSNKSELVILLRPIISTNRTMTTKLENEKKTFQILKRPFHAGGAPKIFGNEGERTDT